jgi:hypothetical protein
MFLKRHILKILRIFFKKKKEKIVVKGAHVVLYSMVRPMNTNLMV